MQPLWSPRTHDELVARSLRAFLPGDIAGIAHALTGTCTVMWACDQEAERVNEPIVAKIAALQSEWTRLNQRHRSLRFHPGKYHHKDSGHAYYLDRKEWQWWDCCQVEIQTNNDFQNSDIIGCQWHGPAQPALEGELARLAERFRSMSTLIVCSICSGGHSGRTCRDRQCSFCLRPEYPMYGRTTCSTCQKDLEQNKERSRGRWAKR